MLVGCRQSVGCGLLSVGCGGLEALHLFEVEVLRFRACGVGRVKIKRRKGDEVVDRVQVGCGVGGLKCRV